ncbi:sigma-70 family RNA polymerase sigma factor [Allopontixanthobacter sp.]|uniref:sigma-70 family RNA polymerase sigma factor n=1 Tax=Allopontixanthobacter sp. TaxID=2906452 RepID=UPI002ABBC21D|nr:sigma-70 family RNA polymerase sigma factor [Allopontixanthobacter sp.]MDZ4307021.1 sigma-70 family RNA polymerase sigma factor [Allopontixanthobacter sp.]
MDQLVSGRFDAGGPGSTFDEPFIEQVRAEMLRFARLQLGDDAEVEDAVQEALAGALRNERSFRAEAAFKTWIIAILKNKIADILRRRQRHKSLAAQGPNDDFETGEYSAAFDSRGKWQEMSRPRPWGNPEESLHSQQFLAIFDSCLGCLPARQARVFMMREIIELEPAEISAETGLSMANIYVLLHRARLGLRACLESNWLGTGAQTC